MINRLNSQKDSSNNDTWKLPPNKKTFSVISTRSVFVALCVYGTHKVYVRACVCVFCTSLAERDRVLTAVAEKCRSERPGEDRLLNGAAQGSH